MIDSLTFPLEDFDLKGFIDAYRHFHRDWSGSEDADLSVVVLERHGGTPLPVYEDRDLAEELIERGWKLFFPVHEPVASDTALCIDGVRRASEEFDIGVADAYGWLVEVRDGEVILDPALYDGSSNMLPTLEIQGRCSVLDECMDRFVRRFVGEGC